jgi:site-specific DNA recombinase
VKKQIAATYARVSLDKQKDNFSLPSQRRAMLKLAQEKGYRVPSEYEFVDDGYLGGEMDRPAFTRMREAVRGGLVKAVICYDLDRLMRSLPLQMLIEEECEKYGVALEFVMLPSDQSAEGKLLRQMRGVFAEFEKAKLKERTTRGRKEKLLAGHVTGGRAPFGYRYVGKRDGKQGELVIDAAQAKTVRKIFRWADEGVKLLDIARRLTSEGVRTATGRPWSKTVLSAMLSNTSYVGEARCNRRMVAEPKTRRKAPMPGKSKKTSFHMRPEAEWITVAVPAIIDAALFDRVRARIERERHINSGRPSPYFLRGLIKCGQCGFACCVFPSNGRPRYRCNNINRLRVQGQRECPQQSVLVTEIEDTVWNEVLYTFEDPARVWELMHGEWAARAKSDKQLAKERAALTRAIEQLKQREFRTRQAMQDADLQDAWAGFRDDLKTILAQRRAQEAQLAKLQPVERPPFDLNKYCKMVDSWRKLKAPEAKREVLRQLVERVDLKDREVTIHFRVGDRPATNCLNHQPAVGTVGIAAEGIRGSGIAGCELRPAGAAVADREPDSGALGRRAGNRRRLLGTKGFGRGGAEPPARGHAISRRA